MGKKSIPNSRRASFPTSTRCSKRSRRSCEAGGSGCGAWGGQRWFQARTPNIEHRTPNIQRRPAYSGCPAPRFVGCSMLDVGCSMFNRFVLRRVKGAWWPSRSSKPLSARSTGRGTFDSYPLRHFKCGVRNADCGIPTRAELSRGGGLFHSAFRTSHSAFLGEGRWFSCRASSSLG
jgi:hypothetical protein